MFFFLVVVFLLTVFWWYLNYSLDYWKRKGVPFVKANAWKEIKSQLYNRVPLTDQYTNLYTALSGCNYGGCFASFRPQLMVRDPDLIQRILLTDFENFRDRGSTFFDESEPLSNHLFSAPANLWRKLRIRLTPTFTSGKIKYMFDLIQECAEGYQQVLLESAVVGEPFDVKDYSVNYTIEVISSAAFGVKTHSMTSESEFKEMSRQIFLPSWKKIARAMIHIWCPPLKKFLPGITFFDKRVTTFFFDMIRETVDYRKTNNLCRKDFLQILMSLNETSSGPNAGEDNNNNGRYHKDEELEFTPELMTAQSFLFFVAGFDTSSLVLSTTLLELAINRHIQDRLYEEIDFYFQRNDEKITYEMIKTMPYLHKVIQESMRKYPVLPILSRVASKAYQIPGTDITIEKGTELVISLNGLHHDPAYFPNPEIFDPERFTDEEIRRRHNFVYLPFGEGPRNCIGSRFGLVSVKLGVVHLLQKYHFETTPETIYPIKYKPMKKINDCGHKLLLKCSPRNRA